MLKAQPDPNLQPDNDKHILCGVGRADLTICAWSDHAAFQNRHNELVPLLDHVELYALRVNRSGMPAHPIYLPMALEPKRYTPQLIS